MHHCSAPWNLPPVSAFFVSRELMAEDVLVRDKDSLGYEIAEPTIEKTESAITITKQTIQHREITIVQPIVETTKLKTEQIAIDEESESEEENKVPSPTACRDKEHNRPNKEEIKPEENDKADEEEDNKVPSPTAYRDDKNNSNIPNQATTTPEDVLSNDGDEEPEDQI